MKVRVDKIKVRASDKDFKYRVTLSGNSYDRFIVNDEEVTGKDTISLSEYPTIKQKITKNVAKHYVNSDGNILEIDDYKVIYDKLIKEYPTLEEEYEFKKFTSIWKIVYDQVTTLEDVVIEDFGTFVLDTESKYIVSDYFFGKNEPICKFYKNAFAIDTLKRIVVEEGCVIDSNSNKYIDDKPVAEIPTHSGIRFAKIAGNYVFTEKYDFTDRAKGGLFEDLLVEQKALEDDIRARVQRTIRALNESLKLSNIEIVNQLENIRGLLYKMDVKKTSFDSHRQVMNSVNKLLGSL